MVETSNEGVIDLFVACPWRKRVSETKRRLGSVTRTPPR